MRFLFYFSQHNPLDKFDLILRLFMMVKMAPLFLFIYMRLIGCLISEFSSPSIICDRLPVMMTTAQSLNDTQLLDQLFSVCQETQFNCQNTCFISPASSVMCHIKHSRRLRETENAVCRKLGLLFRTQCDQILGTT